MWGFCCVIAVIISWSFFCNCASNTYLKYNNLTLPWVVHLCFSELKVKIMIFEALTLNPCVHHQNVFQKCLWIEKYPINIYQITNLPQRKTKLFDMQRKSKSCLNFWCWGFTLFHPAGISSSTKSKIPKPAQVSKILCHKFLILSRI